MKSLLSLLMVTAVMVTAANAQPPAPMADSVATGQAIELFTCVEIDDADEMHPCAVSKIIMVPDPCACKDACGCCAPKCVAIKICVPPACECACGDTPKITCKHDGRKQKYDYGKYSVEIEVKDGYVEVEYDD